MRRVLNWAALAAALLTAGVSRGWAQPSDVSRSGSVTALSVQPGAERADLVIALDGPADVLDFTLASPNRIVVDLRGATLLIPPRLYDKVARGSITNVRFAQWKADVVRVVLELDGSREYTVVRGEHDVKVSVAGSGAPGVAAWTVGNASAVTASAGAPAAMMAVPAAPVAPAPSAAQKPAAPEPRLLPEPMLQEPRISIHFVDQSMRDVITAFALFAKRTIIVGSAVTGTVTADIEDQPWDVALKKILETHGFAALEDSTGMITVDSYANIALRQQVEPLQTKLIQVNYAKAEAMANTVRALLGAGCGGAASAGAPPPSAGGAPPAAGVGAAICSARGAVSHEEKTNTVIVTETAARLADIESYVRDLDVRTPQVAIKAKIISVDRTATEQLGLSYDLGSANGFSNALVTRFTDAAGTQPVAGDFRVNLSGDAFAGVANASRPFKSTSALTMIYNMTIGGFNLTSFLDAMSQERLTDIQAEPSTTTVDNREANLFAGSEQAFLLTPPVIPGQISSAAPQIQRQNIGITLKVTPHVTANRQVLLNVFAEQQTLIDVTIAGPTTAKRTSTNEVLVGDGETAVIAGLTQTQISKVKTGIPILMSLPLIGRLFSQTETIERKQDLLILVTPHIIDEGEVVRQGAPPARP